MDQSAMGRDLPQILNWRRYDARLTTSGQPDADQLAMIADLPVTHIINLAPAENKGALANEAQIVEGLGLGYTHIPVDFDAPSDMDFNAFCTAMAECAGQNVHVHCIYNARVTAFMLRFAQENKGVSPRHAETVMDEIWRPGGAWATFLGRPEQCGEPNRYKGYEY